MSFLFLMVFSICAMAQDKTIIKRYDDGSIKSVRFSPTDKTIPANATEFFSKMLNKRATDDFVLNRSKKASNDMSFERYQQYYQGILVDDGHYNFRFKNGRMKVVKGHYVNVKAINPNPSLTEDEAIIRYASYFGIKNSDIVKSYVKLMIKEIPNTDRKKTEASLVYRVFLHTKNLGDSYIGYIDAHSGELLYKENSSFNSSATGQFYTYYNNNNNIPKSGITEYRNNMYYLEDFTRGSGIRTLTYDQFLYPFNFYDYDNVWTQQEMDILTMALDVHWTMEQIYDWMNYLYNHNSYDGNDAQIESYIIYSGDKMCNASYYYEGDIFCFGTAQISSDIGPLASVDVIGHEYGHALLYNSTGLSPGGESVIRQGIHEGLADIWGIIIENHISPNADIWKSGEQVMINKSCLRNFQYPNDSNAETQIASTYGYGQFNSNDPHIVGGLLPHWFYLLCQGGSDVNEKQDSYALLPVGVDLAEELFAYTTLTTAYLEDCTTFQEVRAAFYDAALDMGDNFLAEQVQNAFYAVGLDVEPAHIYGPLSINGSGSYYVYGNPYYIINWNFTNTGSSPSPTIVSNSSNYSCTVYATSTFSGILNATIYCDGQTVTYSKNISGSGNPDSSANGNILQISSQDNNNYLISLPAIEGKQKIDKEIKVINAGNFQQIYAIKTNNSSCVINTSSWNPGLYIVQVTLDNKTYSTKITVK